MDQNAKTKTAPEQCANTAPGPDQPAAISLAGATMAETNTDTTAPERNDTGEKTPSRPIKTPRSVKRVAAIGIPVSLAAAAAVSFAGLTELGFFAGIDHPWLMPVAIDVYATTATLIAMLLPEGHRARRTAVWNARLGLAMSMSGNAVARALHLGTRGYTISDAILTFIGAWPSLIVERLLHLQGHLTVVEHAPATDTESSTVHADTPSTDTVQTPSVDERPPSGESSSAPSTETTVHRSAAPSSDRPRRASTARPKPSTPAPSTGQPDKDVWVEIGHPVYLTVRDRVGKRPPEGEFQEALAAEAARLIALGQLPDCYAEPSLSTAKRVRKDVETRFPELSPLHLIREAS